MTILFEGVDPDVPRDTSPEETISVAVEFLFANSMIETTEVDLRGKPMRQKPKRIKARKMTAAEIMAVEVEKELAPPCVSHPAVIEIAEGEAGK